MRRWTAVLLSAITVLLGMSTSAAGRPSRPTLHGLHASAYRHVFVIVEENHGFSDVIGNPAAPNLNRLAHRFGLATNYYGVTHPSEPNYVAMLGGSTFGVASDNPYYLNRVKRPSLVTELDRRGVSWKAYLQGSPHPGYRGICYPAFCNGTPDKDPLYVSKHNPITNFTTSWNRRDWSRQVPVQQLRRDLRSGHVPAFGMIIPDECHDQHGDPPYCVDSGAPGDPQDQHLVAQGDRYLGQTVSAITHARFWKHGNNAVVVVYDEGDNNAGCCGARPGGGKVATVVVTSHGPRHVRDHHAYNHYSLLKTIQQNFGLPCLAHTCRRSVAAMRRLFAPTGSPAIPTSVAAVPAEPTPTPTPAEPVTYTSNHRARHGWRVVSAPRVGTADNSFGAVAAADADNLWAVGNYLPDAAAANPDATLTLAAHYNGRRWVHTPTPSPGRNFATLFGVAAAGRQAWAVGDDLGRGFRAQPLIEHWDGRKWSVTRLRRSHARFAMLFAAGATSARDVWAVGQQRRYSSRRFTPLVEHYDGHRWTAMRVALPCGTGATLYGVTAASPRNVWAVGQCNRRHADRPLVEHFDGRRWHVVPLRGSTASGLLDAVTIRHRHVIAVGQTDGPRQEGRPLVANVRGGHTRMTVLSLPGERFTNVNGVAIDRTGTAWATGTVFDPNGTYDGSPGGVQQTLVLRRTDHGWRRVHAPSPGTADRVLGGLVAAGGHLVTVGYYKAPAGRVPLIERHTIEH